MSDAINVQKRDETGSLRMRRLRQSGRIPGIVYGHGQDSIAISMDTRDINRMIRDGRHVVELAGDIKESALIKEVQWDSLGSTVVHVDFARVDATEVVEVSLTVDLRGVAPGTRAGGIVKLALHEIDVRCPALKVPEHLEININGLELEQSITAGEVKLPESAILITDASAVVVACVAPTVELEESEDGEASAEPEVIGRKAEDEEADGS